jgi:hypothetical protein
VDHHPEQGAGARAWPGASARLTSTPAHLRRHAPMLGEHNRPVFHDLLGYSGETFTGLLTEGGAGTVPLAAAVRPPARPTAQRLGISPWGYGRIKEYDAAFKERLSERFGPGFGESGPVVAGEAQDSPAPALAGRSPSPDQKTS